jgi:hypothetical protein
MQGATVRINAEDREVLRELAAREGEPMQAILAKALEAYRRQRFLEDANRAFANLKADRDAWGQEAEERKLWESTLADGMDEE